MNSEDDFLHRTIVDTISALDIGDAVGTDRLSIIPLRTRHQNAREYLTLREAVSSGYVRVTEVAGQGCVREVALTNTGNQPVLVLDGEELVGAKQNRIVNLTILVPAHTSLNVPVSCVEGGRWRSMSNDFVPNGRVHYRHGRAMKLRHVSAALQSDQRRTADQRAIWADINRQLHMTGAYSPTSASAAIYTRRHDQIEELTERLIPGLTDTGAFFLCRGRIVGLELCDAPDTWRRVLPYLLPSYALDAITSRQDDDVVSALDMWPEMFVKRIGEIRPRAYPALGLGDDVRLEGPGICGAALVRGNRIVHLVVLASLDPADVSGVSREESPPPDGWFWPFLTTFPTATRRR